MTLAMALAIILVVLFFGVMIGGMYWWGSGVARIKDHEEFMAENDRRHTIVEATSYVLLLSSALIMAFTQDWEAVAMYIALMFGGLGIVYLWITYKK